MSLKDKIYIFFMYLYNIIFAKTLYKKNIYKRFINEGDKKLLTNYPLNTESIVVDVGGYIGVFSDAILAKYNCTLYIFEPIRTYYELLKDKYKNNPKVHVFHFGLGNKFETIPITIDGERSSIYLSKSAAEIITIRPFHEIILEENIDNIDLISINIEGGEYDLLKNIFDNNLISKIQFLQIQFHDFIENANKKREEVIARITKTHTILFSYPFVWESFTKK